MCNSTRTTCTHMFEHKLVGVITKAKALSTNLWSSYLSISFHRSIYLCLPSLFWGTVAGGRCIPCARSRARTTFSRTGRNKASYSGWEEAIANAAIIAAHSPVFFLVYIATLSLFSRKKDDVQSSNLNSWETEITKTRFKSLSLSLETCNSPEIKIISSLTNYLQH